MKAVSAALGVVVLLGAAVATGQEARKASHVDTVEVRSIDVEARTLTVGSAEASERYAVDDATAIRLGAEPISLSELAVGDRVVVSSTLEGAIPSGPPVADAIQVVQRPQGAADVASAPGEAPTSSSSVAVHVELFDAGRKAVGEATLRETPNGVLIRLSLRGVEAGEHGFHVHEKGRCEPPFESAGGHLALPGSAHGFLTPGGPHAGDLPNVVVSEGGRVEEELFAPSLTFERVRDQDGAALVLHAEADDYATQPSGAAGARVACGVVEPR